MSLSHHPAYQLKIGSLALSAAKGSALLGVVLKAGKHSGAAEAVFTLGPGLGGQVALGDAVQLELGWGDKLERVFTGRVGAVEPQFGFAAPGMVVRAFDDLMQLMRSPRQPRMFENQSPGDIVKAHAAAAGVALGTVENGARLARSYMHRESPYAHCRALADRTGFDLYASADGKLQFAKFARRAADDTLHHGRDLRHVSQRLGSALPGVTVVPESPASSAGDDTAAWLVKDPAAHAANEGRADTLLVSDPALRTRDAAQEAARAYGQAHRRQATTRATLPGRPGVQLGQALALKGVPAPGVDGLYELLALQHRFGVAQGFDTTLTLARMA